MEPEGTYLIWLYFRALNLSVKDLEDFVVHKAKLWLDGGAIFGQSSEGFQRANIACPRATRNEAIQRLESAAKSLN